MNVRKSIQACTPPSSVIVNLSLESIHQQLYASVYYLETSLIKITLKISPIQAIQD